MQACNRPPHYHHTPVTLIPWLCPVSTICSAMDWAFPVTVPYTQLNLGDIFRSKPKFSC